MKYYNQKPSGERINQAEETIINGRDDADLIDVLSVHGYGIEEFGVGYTLFEAVRTADEAHRKQKGIQVAATRSANDAYRQVRRVFNADRRIVRVVLGNQADVVELLRLHLKVSVARGNFILQARTFYANVKEQPEVMTALADQYGITPAILDTKVAAIASFEEALRQQEYLIGQTRVATQRRQEAMEALDTWMKKFIGIARVAFKDDKARLRVLGISVKS